ncbi:purine and uridine phosphorylase [Aspergillus germanicus]
MASSLFHDDYTVAWISALPHEIAASRTMLDEIHPNLPQRSGDTNSYTLGSISGHNVVMVCLPAMGTNSAAAVVNHLRSSFQNVQYGLMVGIGGGVPSEKADIRLGDIVVSKPVDRYPGIMQYDFGKSLAGGRFSKRGLFIAQYLTLDDPLSTIVTERLAQNPKMTSFRCPGSERDQLLESSYDHTEFEDDCSQCDVDRLLKRGFRSTTEPHIWYGLIESGNQVMKDGSARDALSSKFRILCFEMEAAGLMNYLPCLKKWQGYAAMTAAAYTRLLLSRVPRAVPNPRDSSEEMCCRALFITDPEEDLRRLRRRKGGHVSGTCDWVMNTEQLNLWLGDSSQTADRPSIFWLYGNPGVGKSTITIAMAEILQSRPRFQGNESSLAYFFCETSSDKHTSATSILRGLLYQLVQKRPEWIRFLMTKYSVRKETLFTSFDALWSALLAKTKDSGEIYYIINAVDECTPDSQETLLSQLAETFHENIGGSDDFGIHILITSRPYEEFGRHLRQFYHHNLSSFPSLKHDVDLLIEKNVDELSRRNKYPQFIRQEVASILKDKADGHHPDEYDATIRVLEAVAVALHPLTIPELSQFAQLDPDRDEDVRYAFTRDHINMCRLLIVVEFLLRGDQRVGEEMAAHADAAYRCLDLVIDSFRGFKVYEYIWEDHSFLSYAAKNWSQHAFLAKDAFHVLLRHATFFDPKSQVRDAWQTFNNYLIKSREKLWVRPKHHSLSELASQWGILPVASYILKSLEHADIGLSEEVLEIISHIYIPPISAALSQPNVQVAITDELILYWAAVRDKHLWAVRRLLEQGAPPDTADCDSRTPLHYAAFGHRESIVEALLQTDSVNVNAINLEGETPLLEAVRTGDSTIVRLLLNKGADPNVVNFRGQTAYSIAEEKMYLRIMKTLKEFGADTGLASYHPLLHENKALYVALDPIPTSSRHELHVL